MQSSLVPERPLIISPTLAATIGLEEAVLLHVLTELMAHRPIREKDRLRWVELSQQDLCDALPFWAFIDIKRVQKSLLDLGLILLDPSTSDAQTNYFAVNQPREQEQDSRATARPSTGPRVNPQAAAEMAAPAQGASFIPANWQPSQDWIKQCKQQNIPEEFVQQLVSGFVMYWRDRKQARFSWGNAFYKHVLREWRSEQTRRGLSELDTEMSA